MGIRRAANAFSLFPNTQKEFSSFAPYAKSSPAAASTLLGFAAAFHTAGLLCFERHGGWWGFSCCEINRRQMHFIGDSWTRCRHSRRRRRDPRAPVKIATYARLQSGAVVLVARLPMLQALSARTDQLGGRATVIKDLSLRRCFFPDPMAIFCRLP